MDALNFSSGGVQIDFVVTLSKNFNTSLLVAALNHASDLGQLTFTVSNADTAFAEPEEPGTGMSKV